MVTKEDQEEEGEKKEVKFEVKGGNGTPAGFGISISSVTKDTYPKLIEEKGSDIVSEYDLTKRGVDSYVITIFTVICYCAVMFGTYI